MQLRRIRSLITIALTLSAIALAGCKSQPATSPNVVNTTRPQADRPGYRPEYREGHRRERNRDRQRGTPTQADDTPGTFDFYLLNLSWSPEFCLTHPQAAECTAHPGFILHGLWPQNTDGSYPERCSEADGPANEQAYSDILPDTHLLEHEWQTHGTCSGLTPDAYFAEARQAKAAVRIPADLQQVATELQLTPQGILSDFAAANPGLSPDSFALSCGNNRLTAIEVCLTKDLKATSCNSVRSCRANAVKVTPLGTSAQQ